MQNKYLAEKHLFRSITDWEILDFFASRHWTKPVLIWSSRFSLTGGQQVDAVAMELERRFLFWLEALFSKTHRHNLWEMLTNNPLNVVYFYTSMYLVLLCPAPKRFAAGYATLTNSRHRFTVITKPLDGVCRQWLCQAFTAGRDTKQHTAASYLNQNVIKKEKTLLVLVVVVVFYVLHFLDRVKMDLWNFHFVVNSWHAFS